MLFRSILRAYPGGTTGKWIIESNGLVGGLTGSTGNGEGFGGGEFYGGDDFVPSGAFGHQEISNGGLALLTGSGEVAMTAVDPRPSSVGSAGYNSAGVRFLSNTNGAMTDGYQVYDRDDPGSGGTFAKSSGLGDLELLCNTQLLEIGNYVWLDTDKDGVQDPCEGPLSNLVVELWKSGVKIAETTTNTNGNYSFSSKYLLGAAWTGTGVDTTLLPATAYQVRIATAQTPLSMRELTTANATASNGNDQNDSDAALSGVYAVISFTTPANGSDHTLDFGFHCIEPTITSVGVDTATCTNGVIASNAKVAVRGIVNGAKYSYGTNGTTGLFAATATTLTADSIKLTGIANPSVPTTYTFRIYASDTTCYNDTTVTLTRSVCPTCNITATFMQGSCQNNNTTAITTDDYFSVVVSAVSSTNSGTSGKYQVILNGTTVLNTGGTAYGTNITVGGAGIFSSDGTTTYSLKVRDLDISGCETTVFTTTVSANCSVIPCPMSVCLPVTVSRNN